MLEGAGGSEDWECEENEVSAVDEAVVDEEYVRAEAEEAANTCVGAACIRRQDNTT